MWKLVRKDAILGWRILAINGGVALVAPMLLMRLDDDLTLGFYVAWVTLMCAMLPVSIIAKEDKFAATTLTCSLPVTRRSIVNARHLGGWLIGGGSAAIVLMLGLAVPRFRELWGEGSVGAIMTSFVVIGLVIAAFVPFTIRFGLTGVLAGMVALQILGVVAFMTVLVTGGIGDIENTVRAIVDAVKDYHEQVGPALFTATLVAAIAAINWASWALSQRIFRSRDL